MPVSPDLKKAVLAAVEKKALAIELRAAACLAEEAAKAADLDLKAVYSKVIDEGRRGYPSDKAPQHRLVRVDGKLYGLTLVNVHEEVVRPLEVEE